MTSSKPYLIRAIYEWISDNDMTPFVIVDTENHEVSVPERHIKNGEIVLNISANATHNIRIGNDAIECDAKFDGVNFHIYMPTIAVIAIYSQESNQGMSFPPEDIFSSAPTHEITEQEEADNSTTDDSIETSDNILQFKPKSKN